MAVLNLRIDTGRLLRLRRELRRRERDQSRGRVEREMVGRGPVPGAERRRARAHVQPARC